MGRCLALMLVSGSVASFGAKAVDTETHCVLVVVGQKPSGEFITESLGCFTTLGEAQGAEHATVQGSDRIVGEGVSLLTFTLGIHFDGAGGTGSSISIVGDNCNGGFWNTGPTWSNRISSSFNGCHRLRHHVDPDKGGAATDTTGSGSTHNLPGAYDNTTDSVSYWSS